MRKTRLSRRLWAARHAYAFIAPFYLLFLVFGAFPIIWSIYLSFQDWDGLRPMKYVGLRNFAMLLHDQRFIDSVINTTIYWVVDTVFILGFALFMAILLNTPRLAGKRFYRIILFLPNVTATVAIGLVFSMVFDYNSGLANWLLHGLGIKPLGWLNSTQLSKIPVMVLSIWRAVPWYMLIILSGLQTINPELYQAATVDGAGPAQKLLHITIPGLSTVLFFCFLTVTIDSFRLFTEPYILTNGGPGSSSISIVEYLYESGFTTFKLGYASAMGYMLTAILIVISVAQLVSLRRGGSEIGATE
ncbi:MAG: carbohydrate ABC transporter permease [Rectinemataceae bacterium]